MFYHSFSKKWNKSKKKHIEENKCWTDCLVCLVIARKPWDLQTIAMTRGRCDSSSSAAAGCPAAHFAPARLRSCMQASVHMCLCARCYITLSATVKLHAARSPPTSSSLSSSASPHRQSHSSRLCCPAFRDSVGVKKKGRGGAGGEQRGAAVHVWRSRVSAGPRVAEEVGSRTEGERRAGGRGGRGGVEAKR